MTSSPLRIAASPVLLVAARDLPLRTASVREPLARVRPGVYAPRAEWVRLSPWSRYLSRVHAAVQTHPGAVCALESAAALVGLPLFGEPRDVHLIVQGGASRRWGDVVVHSRADPPDTITVDGITMTSPVQTAADLCRVLPPAFGLAVADATVRMVGDVDLHAHGRAEANRRGLRRLEWVGVRATPSAESVGESVSRAAIEWLGYDMPEVQIGFRHERGEDRVDFLWRRAQIVGESDGYGKYDSTDVEAAKAHFIREKIREDRIRRAVTGFARWDWIDVMQFARLDAKLRAAGLTPTASRNDALLSTLSVNPRSLPPR